MIQRYNKFIGNIKELKLLNTDIDCRVIKIPPENKTVFNTTLP